MIIEFTLDEDDFLTHQLYAASKSTVLNKRNKKSKVIISYAYVLISLFFLIENLPILSAAFFVLAILWYFLLPYWQKRSYTNYYKNFIKETYKNRIGKTIKLILEDEFILTTDEGGETKTFTKEVDEIFDINSTIFIKLKNGHWLILPKKKIINIDSLTTKLKELSTTWKVPYIVDHKWK